jgi:hypothetical protein
MTKSKYHVEILPGVWVDVYDVLAAFKVTDPGFQHAIKKMLKTGDRGHKDETEDRADIMLSVKRSNERYAAFQKNKVADDLILELNEHLNSLYGSDEHDDKVDAESLNDLMDWATVPQDCGKVTIHKFTIRPNEDDDEYHEESSKYQF